MTTRIQRPLAILGALQLAGAAAFAILCAGKGRPEANAHAAARGGGDWGFEQITAAALAAQLDEVLSIIPAGQAPDEARDLLGAYRAQEKATA